MRSNLMNGLMAVLAGAWLSAASAAYETTEPVDFTLAQLGGGEVAAMVVIDAVVRLVRDSVEALGGLDIVVNNAGIWVDHVLEEVDFDLHRLVGNTTKMMAAPAKPADPANLSTPSMIARAMPDR